MSVALTEDEVLTPEGVAALRSDNGLAARTSIAASVGKAVSDGRLERRELRVALQIVERLAEDLAVEVRACLAEHVKHALYLPREVALRLAEDIEEVALPVLRCSEVLSDSDLIAIVENGSGTKLSAIAQRKRVSQAVSESLVTSAKREPLRHLLANKGADIGEASYQRLVDLYQGDPDIEQLIVARNSLPAAFVARLVSTISQDLRTALMRRHDMPAVLVNQLADQGDARILLEQALRTTSPRELSLFLEDVRHGGGLTSSFLLRALFRGEIDIFAVALGILTGIPANCTRVLMHDQGPGGLRGLCDKAGIDDVLLPMLRAALRTAQEIRDQTNSPWSAADSDQVIGSVVEASETIGPGSLETVMSQVGFGEVMHAMKELERAQVPG